MSYLLRILLPEWTKMYGKPNFTASHCLAIRSRRRDESIKKNQHNFHVQTACTFIMFIGIYKCAARPAATSSTSCPGTHLHKVPDHACFSLVSPGASVHPKMFPLPSMRDVSDWWCGSKCLTIAAAHRTSSSMFWIGFGGPRFFRWVCVGATYPMLHKNYAMLECMQYRFQNLRVVTTVPLWTFASAQSSMRTFTQNSFPLLASLFCSQQFGSFFALERSCYRSLSKMFQHILFVRMPRATFNAIVSVRPSSWLVRFVVRRLSAFFRNFFGSRFSADSAAEFSADSAAFPSAISTKKTQRPTHRAHKNLMVKHTHTQQFVSITAVFHRHSPQQCNCIQ